MPKISQTKTNFTAGEIAPDLSGRGDLRAYENGALALRNLFIAPTGGVSRRSGTRYVATLPSYGRIVAYEYSSTQTFMLVFTNLQMHVYDNGALITSITSPYTAAQLDQLNWAQTADTLYMTHPDVMIKRIARDTSGTWTITDLSWAKDASGNLHYMPYYKFVAPEVTLVSTQTTGTATINASAAIFTPDWVGVRLRIRSTECVITGYTSPGVVTAAISGTLAATPFTADWAEGAFSSLRGYPVSVAFHQDRLVLGGSRSLPNRLWLSRTGSLYNFNLGTGLDDEAMEFGILSDQINAIRGLVSGRHLQVFTSGAEWVVTGDPLTPTNLQLKRQTRVGSAVDRTIPPIDVEGATLFIARNRDEIREFVYSDDEAAYTATDVALLCRHIITGAVDQDFDKTRRLLFIVRDDGKFATLTLFRPEGVAAWTLHDTNGAAKSIAVIGSDVYIQVYRNGAYTIEKFDTSAYLDAAYFGTSGTPTTTWTGLSHLNGQTVRVIGDGIVQQNKTVSGGTVTIQTAASNVQIGLAFTHQITPLPPNMLGLSNGVHRARLVRATLRLNATNDAVIDVGKGPRTLTLPQKPYTGDISIAAYGWRNTLDQSLWRIASDVPQPFTLLSITTETQVN